MSTEKRIDIIKKSSGFLNVFINDPPTNMFDPIMFAELNVLLDKMEKAPICESLFLKVPIRNFS